MDIGRDILLRELICHEDKPCRAMRERIYVKENWCGDLPSMAPEGKCYFDHHDDCNDKCEYWEGKKENTRE